MAGRCPWILPTGTGQKGWLLLGTGEAWQWRPGSDPGPFVLVLVVQLLVFWVSLNLCFLPSR